MNDVAPAGAPTSTLDLPMADAMGYFISPLRGLLRHDCYAYLRVLGKVNRQRYDLTFESSAV